MSSNYNDTICTLQYAVGNVKKYYFPVTHLAHLAVVEVLRWFFHPVCPAKKLHPYRLSKRIFRNVKHSTTSRRTVLTVFLQFGALQPPISLNFLTTSNVIKINAGKTTRKKQSTLRLRHLHRQTTNGGRKTPVVHGSHVTPHNHRFLLTMLCRPF